VGSALPADGMRPVTRADCTHDSKDGTNARIWHPGPSTPAAIWLVIKRIAVSKISPDHAELLEGAGTRATHGRSKVDLRTSPRRLRIAAVVIKAARLVNPAALIHRATSRGTTTAIISCRRSWSITLPGMRRDAKGIDDGAQSTRVRSSLGALDSRADPQNLPDGLTKQKWPSDTFAQIGSGDYGSAYHERGEIYDLVRDSKITGFAIVSGDRHSFWAGYAASRLPPAKFEPVGISFVGASLASPGTMEAYEHSLPKDHPLRSLFLADRPAGKPEWTYNMLLKHGVRSCLEYAKSFDLKRAHAVSNPKLSPHLEFVDMGGHGYATVRLTSDEMRTEFVCIPRPITRSDRPDGGPLRYRVVHTASLWKPGERPLLRQQVIEGDPGLSI
jgi:hypothetical protein